MKSRSGFDLTVINIQKAIVFQCPTCNQKKRLDIPDLNNLSGNLATISISAGMVCPHTFQAFVDKDLKIRGYQKVDYELNTDGSNLGSSFNELNLNTILDNFVKSDFNILGASIININGIPLKTSLSKVKYNRHLFQSSATLFSISERIANELLHGYSQKIILNLERNLMIYTKVNNHFLLVIARGDPNLQMVMIEIENLIEKLSIHIK